MSQSEQNKPSEIVTMQDDLKSAQAAGLIELTRPSIAMIQGLPPTKSLEGAQGKSDIDPKFLPHSANNGNNLTQPVESIFNSTNAQLWVIGSILTIILLAIIVKIIK